MPPYDSKSYQTCWNNRPPAHPHRLGVALLEILFSLTLFGTLALAVTQLLSARAAAQRGLEMEARQMQQAQQILERLFALPLADLNPTHVDSLVDDLVGQLPPDPFLAGSMGTWEVQLEDRSDPLPGVQVVVRYLPGDEGPARRRPIQLAAWRYAVAGLEEGVDP